MFFTSIASFLQANQTIDVSIGAVAADGRMKVVVKPQLTKGSTAALAQPLALVATPQELDAGFASALTQFNGNRQSLQQQVDVTSTIIEDAKQVEVGRAAKAIKAGGKQASNPDGEGCGNEDDDAHVVGKAIGGEDILDNPANSTSNNSSPANERNQVLILAPNHNDDLLSLMK